ncbi:MAG: hypothetical protein EOO46_17310 [Flavobacterium sp.]|nr:MAG: hypothetical protein EOO46_17310 [Flavobacterium sp.]
MKILKRILFVVLAIIGLVLITALFVKKEMHAEREVVINKSKSDVFAYVKYLKNQNDFSKWASMDPAMKKDFKGTDGTVGFVSAWESDKDDVGKGEQEIKGIKEVDADKEIIVNNKSTECLQLAIDNAKKGSYLTILSNTIDNTIQRVTEHLDKELEA